MFISIMRFSEDIVSWQLLSLNCLLSWSGRLQGEGRLPIMMNHVDGWMLGFLNPPYALKDEKSLGAHPLPYYSPLFLAPGLFVKASSPSLSQSHLL